MNNPKLLTCVGLVFVFLVIAFQSGCPREQAPSVKKPPAPAADSEPAPAKNLSDVPAGSAKSATTEIDSKPPADNAFVDATPEDPPPVPDEPPPVPEEQTIEIPADWFRLGKNEIWVDRANKQVIVAGTICLNFGPLEMFVCPVNTKEHESVIAANAYSREVHAALLALGFNPGSPCQWDPAYKPATGPVIDVDIRWLDQETGKVVTRSAVSMIRDSQTNQPMSQKWVFGGSQIWKDPETGEAIYYGDSGELICLSNFSTATIDLNVESSASNDGLQFEAFTENIPPVGTKVYVLIKPGPSIGGEQTDQEKTEAGPTDKKDSEDIQPHLTGPDDPADPSKTESRSGKSTADK